MKAVNSWNLPILLLIGFLLLLGFKFNQRRELADEVANSERLLSAAKLTVQSELDKEGTSFVRVANQSKEEESDFVNNLRMLAENKHLIFVKWQTMPTPPPPTKAVPSATDVPVPTVIAKKATVEVSGPYVQIRDMLEQLAKGSRFVVIDSALWTRVRVGPLSKINFQITRFVSEQNDDTAAPVTSGTASTSGGIN